jgi:hypothetical protein
MFGLFLISATGSIAAGGTSNLRWKGRDDDNRNRAPSLFVSGFSQRL